MDTFCFFDNSMNYYRQCRSLFEVNELHRMERGEAEKESIVFFQDILKFFGMKYLEFFLSWEKLAFSLFFYSREIAGTERQIKDSGNGGDCMKRTY